MIWAVVPVKDLAHAKQRLAGILSPEHRRALSRAMLDDVVSTLAAAPGLAGLVVVSSDPLARLHASRHGARLLDDPGSGLNGAIQHAAATVTAEAQDGILVLPGDAPLVSTGDIEALLAAYRAGSKVVLSPDRRADGTNALLCAPPTRIAFRYGPGSFAAHGQGARAAGVEPRILDLPGLALDIDTPEDLTELAALARAGATYDLLGDIGLLADGEGRSLARKVV